MTSERAVRANRTNARASTGPRSRDGKARAGQNARKHGLSSFAVSDETEPEICLLVDSLSDQISEEIAVREAVRSVAEAQFQAQRVQMLQMETLTNLRKFATLLHTDLSANGFESIDQAIGQMIRLERYERRALSRRKSLMKRMEAGLRVSPPSNGEG